MDYLTLPQGSVPELLLVFVVGALVGRAIGHWQHCRDMLRCPEILQRVMVPFEERFRSPLNARKWPAFGRAKAAARSQRRPAMPPAGNGQVPCA